MITPPDPQAESIDAADSTTTRMLSVRFMLCPRSALPGRSPQALDLEDGGSCPCVMDGRCRR